MNNHIQIANTLHYFIEFFIITIPIHPIYLLKYTVYTPLLLKIIWLLFGGCPLTNISKSYENEPTFLHKQFLKLNSNITHEHVEKIISLYIVSSIYIGFNRMLGLTDIKYSDQFDAIQNINILDLTSLIILSIIVLQYIILGNFHKNPITTSATITKRTKIRTEKAFTLAIELKFNDPKSAIQLIDEWTVLARWCMFNESFLLHYEISQSDNDPLKYLVYERYISKNDHIGAHRSSWAFNEFRPKLKELQDLGKVVISGNSYVELGKGFV